MAVVITQQRPGRLAVCLDLDWRPQFRVDLIPSYKAHRVAEAEPQGEPDIEEVPDDLTPAGRHDHGAAGRVRDSDGGRGGFRGRRRAGHPGGAGTQDPVVVVSGDRDLLQVVADDPVPVRVLYLGRGLAKATLFGPAEVAEHYGVPVDRAGAAYAELALMRGDPSDGLPGVPGVGEKTAADTAGPARLAGADPGRRPRPQIQDGQGSAHETAGRHRLHRGRREGGAGGHRRARHAFDAHRRATAGRRRPAHAPPNWRPNWASGRRSAACRKRSTRCPRDDATRGRPTS